MDTVMGYGQGSSVLPLPSYQQAPADTCFIPPFRRANSSTGAIHTSHYSPYRVTTADKHRHKKRYTSMGVPEEEDNVNAKYYCGSDNEGNGQLMNGTVNNVPTNTAGPNGKEVVRCKSAPNTPFRPFREDNRTDEYYRRYLQLSGNMAYRYPEPGYPRERQGAIGGTWRHIKEVTGYSGGQVCFVDGLVRLYDYDFKQEASPSKQRPHMRHSMGTPAFAPNRHDITSYGKTLQKELEQHSYKPWVDPRNQQFPTIETKPKAAPMSPGKPSRYKGFYSYN